MVHVMSDVCECAVCAYTYEYLYIMFFVEWGVYVWHVICVRIIIVCCRCVMSWFGDVLWCVILLWRCVIAVCVGAVMWYCVVFVVMM